MEAAINRSAKEYSRYGSAVHKQVYLYGHLDTRPTEIQRTFGMAWGVGGWLLFPFLNKIGPAAAKAAWATALNRAMQKAAKCALHRCGACARAPLCCTTVAPGQ